MGTNLFFLKQEGFKVRYFFVKDKVEVKYDELGHKFGYNFNPIPPDTDEVDTELIYFTTADHLENIAQECSKFYKEDKLFELPNLSIEKFPILIDKSKKLDPILKKLSKKQKKISVGIVNGMSSAIGDHLVGMRAVNILHQKLREFFDVVEIVLYQLIPQRIMPINLQENIIKKIYSLPCSVARLEEHDIYYDFGGFIARPNFNDRPMIDFFLEELGINTDKVPADQKRNRVKLSDRSKLNLDDTLKAMKSKGKLLMFHHEASSDIRGMHEASAKKIAGMLLENTDYTIVSTYPKFSINHPRFINISDLTRDFDSFVYLISQMDYIVTVDTVVYHLADAFNVPTLVLFTCIEPDYRIRYYPNVRSIMLETKDGRLYGKHKSNATNDKFHARKLFDKLKLETLLDGLKEIEAITHKNFLTCPICDKKVKDTIKDWYVDYTVHACDGCEGEFMMPRKAQDYDKAYKVGDSNTACYDHYLNGSKTRTRSELINGYTRQMRFDIPKKIVSFLPSKGKSLDIGCANGFWVGYMQDLGFESYGIDAAKEVIKLAKEKMESPNFAVCKDITKLPKTFPAKFDVITSYELVEHLEDPKKFANQIYEILSDDGLWIFSTPNRNRLQFAAGLKNTKIHHGMDDGDYGPEHLQRFTAKTHQVLLQEKFDIIVQKSSFINSATIENCLQEEFPKFEMKMNNKVIAATAGTLEAKLNPVLSLIDNYGNFLITVAKKKKIS